MHPTDFANFRRRMREGILSPYVMNPTTTTAMERRIMIWKIGLYRPVEVSSPEYQRKFQDQGYWPGPEAQTTTVMARRKIDLHHNRLLVKVLPPHSKYQTMVHPSSCGAEIYSRSPVSLTRCNVASKHQPRDLDSFFLSFACRVSCRARPHLQVYFILGTKDAQRLEKEGENEVVEQRPSPHSTNHPVGSSPLDLPLPPPPTIPFIESKFLAKVKSIEEYVRFKQAPRLGKKRTVFSFIIYYHEGDPPEKLGHPSDVYLDTTKGRERVLAKTSETTWEEWRFFLPSPWSLHKIKNPLIPETLLWARRDTGITWSTTTIINGDRTPARQNLLGSIAEVVRMTIKYASTGIPGKSNYCAIIIYLHFTILLYITLSDPLPLSFLKKLFIVIVTDYVCVVLSHGGCTA